MAETEAAPQERRRVRSYSQLESYKKCSWEFYLKRIRRLPETPSMWSPGGTAFHAATEAFDKETWQQDLAGFDDGSAYEQKFLDVFEEELAELRNAEPDETQWRVSQRGKTKSNPAGEDAEWWRLHGPAMVGRYILWRTSTDDTLTLAAFNSGPAVEVEVSVTLGGVPIIGYIDRVMQDRVTGVLEIVDHKSGRRMPDKPDQLGFYSVAYELVSGQPCTWGDFYNARKGSLVHDEPISLTSYTARELAVEFGWLDAAIGRGEFVPSVTRMCVACGMRRYCKFVGGEEPPQKGTN